MRFLPKFFLQEVVCDHKGTPCEDMEDPGYRCPVLVMVWFGHGFALTFDDSVRPRSRSRCWTITKSQFIERARRAAAEPKSRTHLAPLS